MSDNKGLNLDDFFPDDDDLNRFQPDPPKDRPDIDSQAAKALRPEDFETMTGNKRLTDMDETELASLSEQVRDVAPLEDMDGDTRVVDSTDVIDVYEDTQRETMQANAEQFVQDAPLNELEGDTGVVDSKDLAASVADTHRDTTQADTDVMAIEDDPERDRDTTQADGESFQAPEHGRQTVMAEQGSFARETVMADTDDFDRQTRMAEGSDFARQTMPADQASFGRETVAASADELAALESTSREENFTERLNKVKARKSQSMPQMQAPPKKKGFFSAGCLIMGVLIGLMSGVMVLGAFFLPPLNQYNPLLDGDDAEEGVFTSENYTVEASGLEVAVHPNDVGDDYRVDITYLDVMSGDLDDTTATCIRETNPPDEAEQIGDIFVLEASGTAPTQIGLRVPVSETFDDPNLVDVFGWFGGEEWVFIPSQLSDDGAYRVTDINALPQCLVVAQFVAPQPNSALTLGLGQTFVGSGDATRIYIRGMQPTPQGTLTGILPSGVSADQGYELIPMIANYSDSTVIDVETIRLILENPQTRQAHVANLAAFAQAGAYSGLALDYRDVPSDLRVQYATLIQQLGDVLQAQSRSLVVVVPPPNRPNSGVNGYDLRVMGAFADVIIMRAPLEPAAFVDGRFDAMMAWATGEVYRYKLQVGHSALSVKVVNGASLTDAESAWQGIDGINFAPQEIVAPDTPVRSIFNSPYEVTIGLDDTLQMPYVRYRDAGVDLQTYWITTSLTLFTHATRVAEQRVGGVVWFDAFDAGVSADILSIWEGQPVVTTPTLDMMWTISDGAGNIIATETIAPDAPLLYIPDGTLPLLRFQAQLDGMLFRDFGSADLTVDSNVSSQR